MSLQAAALYATVSVTGATAAKAELAGMGGAVNTAGAGLSKLGTISSGLGGALSHAKSAIGGLISGPLGMIALGGGALGLAGFIKGAIDNVQSLGLAVEKLAPITGDTAEQTSALIAVFNRYGISTDTATTRLGFMQKALGTIALSTKTLTKFQDEFGFSIVDASGKVLDANTILGKAADYWNSSASASEKAALEAKLFGRGYADMIPILNLGSKGINDAEAAATALGETLTIQNAGELAAYTDNMRTLGQAVNGLQLQIGLALIPVISGLAKSLTGWLTNGGSAQLLAWFRDGVTFAQDLGHAIETVVVPGIHMIASAWDAIPGPIKTLILGAFIANKAVKWLFGIDVSTIAAAGVKLAASFLGGIAGNVGSALSGGAVGVAEDIAGVRVFVTNWAMMSGAGGAAAAAEGAAVGGGEAAAGGAAAGLGTLLAPVAAFAGIVVASVIATGIIAQYLPKQAQGTTPNPTKYGIPTTAGGATLGDASGGIPGAVGEHSALGAATTAAINSMETLRGEHAQMTATDQKLENANGLWGAAVLKAAGWAGTFSSSLQTAEKRADKAFLTGIKDKNLASDAGTITSYWLSLSSSYFSRNLDAGKNLQTKIDQLKADSVAATKAGDSTLAGKLNTDIAQLQGLQTKVAGLNTPLADITAAVKGDTRTAAEKMDAVKTAIAMQRLHASVSVSMKASPANFLVDGRNLAHAIINYFPTGTKGFGVT